MKKLLQLCLILVAGTLSAQNFTGGIQAGLNVSQVDGDGVSGFNKAGINLGGFVDYSFSERLALQIELVYESLGSSSKQQLIVATRYLSMPVLFEFRFPIEEGGRIHELQGEIGPVFGYLISANDFDVDITGTLKTFDLRGVIGAEYRYTRVGVFARYGYSLIPFTKSSNDIPSGGWFTSGPYHSFVTFGLRFYFAD